MRRKSERAISSARSGKQSARSRAAGAGRTKGELRLEKALLHLQAIEPFAGEVQVAQSGERALTGPGEILDALEEAGLFTAERIDQGAERAIEIDAEGRSGNLLGAPLQSEGEAEAEPEQGLQRDAGEKPGGLLGIGAAELLQGEIEVAVNLADLLLHPGEIADVEAVGRHHLVQQPGQLPGALLIDAGGQHLGQQIVRADGGEDESRRFTLERGRRSGPAEFGRIKSRRIEPGVNGPGLEGVGETEFRQANIARLDSFPPPARPPPPSVATPSTGCRIRAHGD